MYFNIVNINFVIIVLLSFILCNQKNNDKNKCSINEKVFLVVSFLLLTFVMIFRYTTYYIDYNNYSIEFLRSSNMTLKQIFLSKSPVLFAISAVLNKITTNSQIFFVCTGFFIMISFYRWIAKYADNKYLSIIVFVGLLYYSSAMNIVRQYVAISILLFGYDYITKEKMKFKDIIKIVFIFVIAISTHLSAIIGVVWLVLKKIHLPKSNLKGVVLLAIVYSVSSILIYIGTNTLYSGYLEKGTYGRISANVLGIILPLFVFIFAWIYRGKLIDEDKNNNILVNASAFNLFFTINSITSMLIIARVAIYMSVFNILLIPKIVDKVLIRFNYRTRNFFAVLIVCLYYFVMIYTNRVNYVTEFRFLI